MAYEGRFLKRARSALSGNVSLNDDRMRVSEWVFMLGLQMWNILVSSFINVVNRGLGSSNVNSFNWNLCLRMFMSQLALNFGLNILSTQNSVSMSSNSRNLMKYFIASGYSKMVYIFAFLLDLKTFLLLQTKFSLACS